MRSSGRLPIPCHALPCAGLRRYQARALRVLALAVALWSLVLPSEAAQLAASFKVSVTLTATGPSDTALCSSKASEASVGAMTTVVCATGEVPTPGSGASGSASAGAQRFLTYVSGKEQFGTIDTYAGVGTTTAFRVVSLGGRAYVEMTVGW